MSCLLELTTPCISKVTVVDRLPSSLSHLQLIASRSAKHCAIATLGARHLHLRTVLRRCLTSFRRECAPTDSKSGSPASDFTASDGMPPTRTSDLIPVVSDRRSSTLRRGVLSWACFAYGLAFAQSVLSALCTTLLTNVYMICCRGRRGSACRTRAGVSRVMTQDHGGMCAVSNANRGPFCHTCAQVRFFSSRR